MVVGVVVAVGDWCLGWSSVARDDWALVIFGSEIDELGTVIHLNVHGLRVRGCT